VQRNNASIKIENVVASATLEHGIDLLDVKKAFPKMKYRPKRFPGLIFRLKRPRTTILIFTSGKMVCTGAKSTNEVRRALKIVIEKLKKAGIIILGSLSIQIQNIVASANLGGKIDLVTLYDSERHRAKMMYEPEQFPALIYRMEEPKVVILLFSSGRLVCTGVKKEEHIYEVVNRFYQGLKKHGHIFYSEQEKYVFQQSRQERKVT
jgi:transcription initiation factor TFIID TATA-box-binding protein